MIFNARGVTDRLVDDGEEAIVRYVDKRAGQRDQRGVEQRPAGLSLVVAERHAAVESRVDRHVDRQSDDTAATVGHRAVVRCRQPQVRHRRIAAGGRHFHRRAPLYAPPRSYSFGR